MKLRTQFLLAFLSSTRALPALEAAHIKPYAKSGPHLVDNGLLLRRDIHGLFDRGHVTVSTDHRFEVSRRIRDDFENGPDYYNPAASYWSTTSRRSTGDSPAKSRLIQIADSKLLISKFWPTQSR
jgi:putative restriction endonuclease